MPKYRPDIDGLRAIAVCSVVLFHAGFGGMPGGFVGVDVFFVISGYLITGNLLNDLDLGRFSLAGFYERRARRILPALFVMMLGAALGTVMFLPDDLKLFAESAVAAVLSLSNLFFFRHTGYFDVGAGVSPLLHTWSLAVEEQFYIVFPPLLWVVSRLARGRRAGLVLTLAALWAASFAFSLWQVGHDQRAAFYLPFDRAWELLTGSLLATGVARGWTHRAARETAAALGLALILAPALLMASTAPFPGLNALAPCLGTALVIWAGEGARLPLVVRPLQARPVVFVGLISYSLYLWHWPLLVFVRYYSLGEPGAWLRAATVAAAFGVAVASWAFVERPFRTRALLATRRRLFTACAAAGAAVALCGGVVVLAKGLPQRLTPSEEAYAVGADDHNAYRDHCFALTAQDLDAGRFCRIGVTNARPTLMVWGDSHADAMMAAFDAAARAHGVAGLNVTHGSCPPLLGVEVHEQEDNLCPPLAAAALALIERYDIREIVLAGRWAGYAEGRLYIDGAPPVILRPDGAPLPRRDIRRNDHAVFAAAVSRTFARLRSEGRRVYVVLPVPEVDRPVPVTLARAKMLHETIDFAPTRAAYDARQAFVRATLDRLARRYGVDEIDPAARLCGPQRCRLTEDGHPLYYDDDHLSVHGAQFLAPILAPVFAPAPALPRGQIAEAASSVRR